MSDVLPHLSTDQVAAFVEVSRHGQIRAAAGLLAISEQGLRNRLLASRRSSASSCIERCAGRDARRS
jgi:hypothetical protein